MARGRDRRRGGAKALPLCAAVAAAWLVALSVPEGARPLSDRVTIRRDTFGVPHILADDEEAAAFGLGYAQAEDHPLEIAQRYLGARGDAARVVGTDARESDFAARRFDNAIEARRALGRVGRSFRRVLEAFAGGVNRYFDRHRATLPAWVPVVEAGDVLAYTRMGALTSALSASTIADLRKKYEAPAPTPIQGANVPPAFGLDDDGSNALALSGRKTRSGNPILLGNPHLRWSSVYWEAHLSVPGRLNFYGSTLIGLPTLRAGFNDRLGYVQTNNDPDLEDFYALTLESSGSDRYRFNGRVRALQKREVAVAVRQPDGSLAEERRTYWDSHLGPIVYRTPTRAFAIRSVALEAWRYFEGFQALMAARDLRGFVSRLERGQIPTSNFTYADVEGNILYQWNARLPKRLDAGASYELDVPGEDRRLAWRGTHALRDLPRLLNPPGGYVQNANNSPWWTSLRDRMLPDRFPSYVERHPLGLRPQRALEMIEAQDRFGPDEVRALKFDTRLLLADRVLPDLLAAGRGGVPAGTHGGTEVPPSFPDGIAEPAVLTEALGVLERWDRRADERSRGTLLFVRFWDAYRTRVKEPFREPWTSEAPAGTPRGLSDPAAALRALADAAAAVQQEVGRLDAPWGDVSRFRAGDVDLAGNGADGSYGVYRVMRFEAPAASGSSATPARVAGRLDAAEPPAGFGDAWVLLVHFSRPVEAWSILAYGQSADPASAHGRDQLHRFSHGQLRRVWFSEAEIQAHLERSYRP